MRPTFRHAPINEIIPNSNNPRKNDAIKTEEIQAIIRNRGWESPLTVYKKGPVYVVLSGHRRLFAAQQMKVKELPIYIVEAPKTAQEEIERLASLQGGQVDWSTYEWANVTYERWVAAGKPSIADFSKQTGMSTSTITRYLRVFETYPRHEVETKLENGTFSILTLANAARWMGWVKEKYPQLFVKLGEDIIRRSLLQKVERKIAVNSSFSSRKVFEVANQDDIQQFLVVKNMRIDDILDRYDMNAKKKTLRGQMNTSTRYANAIKDFDAVLSAEDQVKLAEKYREVSRALIREAKRLEKQASKQTVVIPKNEWENDKDEAVLTQ